MTAMQGVHMSYTSHFKKTSPRKRGAESLFVCKHRQIDTQQAIGLVRHTQKKTRHDSCSQIVSILLSRVCPTLYADIIFSSALILRTCIAQRVWYNIVSNRAVARKQFLGFMVSGVCMNIWLWAYFHTVLEFCNSITFICLFQPVNPCLPLNTSLLGTQPSEL